MGLQTPAPGGRPRPHPAHAAARRRPAALPERLLPLARRLRRQFQALAPERTRKQGEASGPDIDLDRLVRFLSNAPAAAVAEPPLYQAWPPGGRSLACLLLADISLSTESWLGDAGQVIQVIRDSLLLFAEALTACGDAFGLYGFFRPSAARKCAICC